MRFSKRIITYFFVGLLFPGTVFAQKYDYPFTKERDPFTPLVSKTGQILIVDKVAGDVNLLLKGIIYSAKESNAIINDEIVKENNVVGEYTVFKIEQKRVILKKGDEELILKLEEE